MSLAEIPEVVIAPHAEKFIVAEVRDPVGGGSKLVVRAAVSGAFGHRGIFGDLCEETKSYGLDVDCLGGGCIEMSYVEKTVFICDRNRAFGEEPDRRRTIRMLQTAFFGFRVSGTSTYHDPSE